MKKIILVLVSKVIFVKFDDLIWQHRTTAKDIFLKTGISENTLSRLRNNDTKRC